MSLALALALLRAAAQHNEECATCAPVAATTLEGLQALSTDPSTPYTDGVHLAADDVEALHRFARRIGLRREWFQKGGERFRGRGPVVSHDHYDMTTTRAYHRARRAGALFIPPRLFSARRRIGRGLPLVTEARYDRGAAAAEVAGTAEEVTDTCR